MGSRSVGLLVSILLLWSTGEAAAQYPTWLERWQVPSQRPAQRPDQQPVQPSPSLGPFQPPTTIPSVPIPAPIEFGPEKVGKVFELKWGADIVEEYSDNFTFVSVGAIENFRTLLVPRGTLLIHGAHVEGLISSRLATAWDSSTREWLFLPEAFAQFSIEVTPRWTLGASGSFVRSDSPATSNRLDIQPQRTASTAYGLGLTSNYAFTTLALRQSYRFNKFDQDDGSSTTNNSFGVGASLTLAQINTLSLDYTYSLSETTSGSGNAGGAQGTTGSQTTSGNQKTNNDGWEIVGSVSREVTARFVAGVAANYASRTSKQSGGTQGTTTGGSQGDTTTDFTRYGATFFSTYTLSSFVLRGSFGVARLKSGSTVEDTVLSTMTGLTYFAGPLTLDGSLESGFSDTFASGGQNFGVVKSQGGAAGASYAFTPKITGRIGASYRVNDQTGVGGGEAGTKNEAFTGTASLSWQAREWLGLNLDYTYSKNRPVDGDSSSSGSSGTGSGGGNSSGFQENHIRFAVRFDF